MRKLKLLFATGLVALALALTTPLLVEIADAFSHHAAFRCSYVVGWGYWWFC